MRRTLFAVLAIFSLALAPAPGEKFFARPLPQTPGEVFAIINQYRAENGLPPYQENPILMQIAQGQADYLASLGQSNDVHAGPGGSRPRDRAFAAGYGGAAQFFLSEIGKYGMGETAQSAVNWWKQSPDHNPTMIASTYVEMGCGVATDGNGRYYFICDTGYIVGGAYVASSGSSSTSQQSAAPVMIPVVKADPKPDGSVVHIIRTGQTLWTLAAVYEVPLQQILELNQYSEAQVIHPGDEVIVAGPGSAPTSTPSGDDAQPSASATSTEQTAATREPRSTAVQPTSAQITAQPTEDEQLAQTVISQQEAEAQNSTVKLVVGVSLAGIVGVIVASFFIQKPRPPAPPDNDPFAPIE